MRQTFKQNNKNNHTIFSPKCRDLSKQGTSVNIFSLRVAPSWAVLACPITKNGFHSKTYHEKKSFYFFFIFFISVSFLPPTGSGWTKDLVYRQNCLAIRGLAETIQR